MRDIKLSIAYFLAYFMVAVFLTPVVGAWEVPHPGTYTPSPEEVRTEKNSFDDPRPLLKNTNYYKKWTPKELADYLSYDVDTMKRLWPEVVGFKAADIVGKIHPEIKPGKYTYKDVQGTPAFKELMVPELYRMSGPGGPPHAYNFPEFEIVPTRNYYYPPYVAEAMLQNAGKAKLTSDGYLIWQSAVGTGFPFPRPSGEFKAQQIVWNRYRDAGMWDGNAVMVSSSCGFNKAVKKDFDGTNTATFLKVGGRLLTPPGTPQSLWYDKGAEQRGEQGIQQFFLLAPRDTAGMAYRSLMLLDYQEYNQTFVYLPFMRRIRKMSATDTQDPSPGMDYTFDDGGHLMQKLSPTMYPYKYEVIAEREYLAFADTTDGAEYLSSSNGIELRNVRLERRPCWVVQMTQLDRTYLYGKRILYFDKEKLGVFASENYDQKGRLYRTQTFLSDFRSEMGASTAVFQLYRDYVDQHSSHSQQVALPAFYGREDCSLTALVKKGK